MTESERIAEEVIGSQGRIISMRKSVGPPGAIYNAMVFNETGERVWSGDLDMEMDQKKLITASERIGSTLYVLEERAGVTLKQPVSNSYLYNIAVAIAEKDRILLNGRIILKMKQRRERNEK